MAVNEMRCHDLSVSYQKVGVSIGGELRSDGQDGYLEWRSKHIGRQGSCS